MNVEGGGSQKTFKETVSSSRALADPSAVSRNDRFLREPSAATRLDRETPTIEVAPPSHAFPVIGDFTKLGAMARIPWAFAEAEIGDRTDWVSWSPIGGPVSNLDFPISGICLRAWPRPVGGPRRPVRIASRIPSGPPNDAGLADDGMVRSRRVGSGEPELLFLVRPDCRQVAHESGDG